MDMQPLTRATGPVSAAERIQTLDVLRGFALLGILLMNIEAMAGPVMAAATGLDPALAGPDRWADALVYVFVQGKFFTLFSLLFGIGFAVMSERAHIAGRPFTALYWRRSLVLLVFGLIHALLIWSGDILVAYALLGMLLLAFRDVSGRWLLWLAVASFLAPLALILLLGLIGSLIQSTPELAAAWKQAMGEQDRLMADLLAGQRQAFGDGSYWEAMLQRGTDLGISLMNLMVVGPLVFGMFLLGSWLVKGGAIAHPQTRPRLFHAMRWLALPSGLVEPHSIHCVLSGHAWQCADVPWLCGNGGAWHAVASMGRQACMVGAGRSHGVDQLPDAVADLHDGFLRLWPGIFRAACTRMADPVRATAIWRASDFKPKVASPLPFRSCRMGLALFDLSQDATYAG
jgi:uncharacterized membrane protein YeiB